MPLVRSYLSRPNPHSRIAGLVFTLALLALSAWAAGPLRAHASAAQQSSPPLTSGLPPAPNSRVYPLTAAPGWFTEPSIAVNPNNPSQVVAAFQDNAHVSFSIDGGRSWNLASGTAPPNYRVSGDVSISYDRNGHAILCYIAFDKLGTAQYWAHNATRNGIFVRRSLDGGKTWETNDITVIAHPNAPGIPFEDKPYVVADNTSSRYAGNLYIGWTHFTLENSSIYFSRSTDGGLNWSAPITISSHPGLPRDDTGADEGFDAVVAPDGAVYAIWSDGLHIVLAVSRDGGRHFSRSREIFSTAPSYFKPENVSRGDGFPQISIDPRGGKAGGPLFITWTDYTNGDIDVFSSTSANHGRSWSAPVRVNTDPVHNGADQFMQWSAADPLTGAFYVVFYDRRADPENRRVFITLARSTDAGRTFQNYSWTDSAFDPQDAFIGDYAGLAAFNGCVYGDWTEESALLPSSSAARPGRRPPHSLVFAAVARFPGAPGHPQACP